MGTYPPRECGIATFNQDLLRSSRQFLGPHISCKVAAMNLSPLDHYNYPSEVAWEINQDNKREYANFAKKINDNALIAGVILQHEYGICGGEEGENILSFIENCRKPILVTLHAVLPSPSPKMQDVTGKIVNRANIIVVLTQNSRRILKNIYPSSEGKVYVIPHGIHPTEFSTSGSAKKKLKLKNSIVLSTFGLLGREKGIEYVIQSLPQVIKKYPSIRYLIIGETHPDVRRKEGETYRLELGRLVTDLGLNKHVKFYDQYLDLTDLIEFLKATDVYISSSINPNQAVSGTLSYALGTGRAVISTQFAQALEIVTPDIGRLVPIKDFSSYTVALLDLLGDKSKLKKMHRQAYDTTRSMLWNKVAEEYSNLLAQVVLPPINLRHLKKMTDNFGLFQFAVLETPDKSAGYTLDDNARALIVCNQLTRHQHRPRGLSQLISTYLNFIEVCQQPDGTFTNYIGYLDKRPTSQNSQEDLSDAYARALWALAEVMKNPLLSTGTRNKAQRQFFQALPHANSLTHLRSKAFIVKALVAALEILPKNHDEILKLIRAIAASLTLALKNNSGESWQWFETHLGYNNALLSESLLIAGELLKNKEYVHKGLSSLQFLKDKTFSTNMYLPIGHSHWYKQNEERSYFDQQPEDPASMILALTSAYKITGIQSYKNLAIKCFSWFLGNNSLCKLLYNYDTGSCYDGLHPDRVNLNQGAESLTSYLLSRLAIDELDNYESRTITKHLS